MEPVNDVLGALPALVAVDLAARLALADVLALTEVSRAAHARFRAAPVARCVVERVGVRPCAAHGVGARDAGGAAWRKARAAVAHAWRGDGDGRCECCTVPLYAAQIPPGFRRLCVHRARCGGQLVPRQPAARRAQLAARTDDALVLRADVCQRYIDGTLDGRSVSEVVAMASTERGLETDAELRALLTCIGQSVSECQARIDEHMTEAAFERNLAWVAAAKHAQEHVLELLRDEKIWIDIEANREELGEEKCYSGI